MSQLAAGCQLLGFFSSTAAANGQGSVQHSITPELLSGPASGCISGSSSVHISQDGAPLLLATAAAAAAAQPCHAAREESSSTRQVAAAHRPTQAPVLRKWNVEGVACRVGIGRRA
jgi:hypothetical protein